MEIVKKLEKNINHRKATFKYINALSLMSPSMIYKAMNKALYNPVKNDLKTSPAIKLMQKLQEDKRIKFIIIDEVDYLYTKNQNILYNLF